VGSPRPPGMGLSPEAPQAPPAPGGRAPSFGAPTPKSDWSFRWGGRFFAWETVGFGRDPEVSTPGQPSSSLHTPAIIEGRQPAWPQTGASFNFDYGNSIVRALVTFNVRAAGKEYNGYFNAPNGPSFGQAYLSLTPPPMGKLRLQFKVGAFTEAFAGPGPWSWGIFGPLIAVRGYGQSTIADYDATSEIRLNAEYGLLGVPGVSEDFVRGNWTGWTETGVSTITNHAHAGLTFRNNYWIRLHYAHAAGTDERRYLIQDPQDGHMDAYAVELHGVAIPYGQLGVSAAYWDFEHAFSVHDGIWWGIDWTKGAQDMIRKFVGSNSNGTGRVAAISAQYDFSLAQLLWHPRPYDGNAPDVRVTLAGVQHWTLDSDDPQFEDADGSLLGAEVFYQMLPWFGVTLRSYGESRDSPEGRWEVYSVSPGLSFRSNWQSTDRIELIYTRRFYNDVVDNNPAEPLDRDVLALGAYIEF
jgi:hypothetical protein